jgi:lipoprotein-releasing system permease protein
VSVPAGWSWRVALRYFASRRRLGSPFFSVAGIAAGIMTLTAVLGVMNGFQRSFIVPILEVRSYHLQVAGGGPEAAAQVRRVPGVTSVSRFVDIQTIAGGSVACVVRALDPDPADAGFVAAFGPGSETPAAGADAGTVYLGSQLAARLGARRGDVISFFAFAAAGRSDVAPRELELTVAGIFRTGYYDLDLNWALAPIATADLVSGQQGVTLGVKLRRPADELEAARRIERALGPAVKVTGWSEVNRLFFTALKTEKAMMMLLIGLVFVVVAANIFHSLRRAVQEREEEIAMMRAIGATADDVRAVFALEGLLIGVCGALAGNALGLLAAYNVNEIFKGAELLVNGVVLPVVEALARPLFAGRGPAELAIFSPRVFYIDRVPAAVLLPEALFGSGVAIACALVAASAASRRAALVRPQEILRRV